MSENSMHYGKQEQTSLEERMHQALADNLRPYVTVDNQPCIDGIFNTIDAVAQVAREEMKREVMAFALSVTEDAPNRPFQPNVKHDLLIEANDSKETIEAKLNQLYALYTEQKQP